MTSIRKVTVTAVTGVLVAALSTTPASAQTQKTAAGYVVIEFMVKDADAFKEYAQRAAPIIAQHGGKFIVRGGRVEGLTGDAPNQGPFIVLAFDSMDQAKKWASSPEYGAVIPICDKAVNSRIFIVEGTPPNQ
jgi:uncharacterized protein (DUF1330 family)